MQIKKNKAYTGVIDTKGGVFIPSSNSTSPALEAGAYKISFDRDRGTVVFNAISFTSDEILDLPSAAYQQVVREMERFLKPETKEAFRKHGYIYKRSSLLHGVPGTGKTCIANRIAQHMIGMGSVVLFAPNPMLLQMAFSVLEDLQPEQTVLVIFEEMDQMIADGDEEDLLLILDGQIQKDNVIYLATTNNIDAVPQRMYRPGRMSSVVEVLFPEADARRAYFEAKLGKDSVEVGPFTDATEGLSIDECKEVIQSVILLGYDLQSTIQRLKDTKNLADAAPSLVISGKQDKQLEKHFARHNGAKGEGNFFGFDIALPVTAPSRSATVKKIGI